MSGRVEVENEREQENRSTAYLENSTRLSGTVKMVDERGNEARQETKREEEFATRRVSAFLAPMNCRNSP